MSLSPRQGRRRPPPQTRAPPNPARGLQAEEAPCRETPGALDPRLSLEAGILPTSQGAKAAQEVPMVLDRSEEGAAASSMVEGPPWHHKVPCRTRQAQGVPAPAGGGRHHGLLRPQPLRAHCPSSMRLFLDPDHLADHLDAGASGLRLASRDHLLPQERQAVGGRHPCRQAQETGPCQSHPCQKGPSCLELLAEGPAGIWRSRELA
mmetsp:Transcript_6194/g.15183  ORF Transcript_6194/g.15183 Transcript_6194/m.15183 type:complete len:206 (-) Transcript_6194:581-1198(-)